MKEFVLVLNAGSSSLKFAVYRGRAGRWEREAGGQIDGIGSSARFSVKGADGGMLADEKLDTVRDGARALDALAAWLR